MTQVYTSEYLATHDVVDLTFTDNTGGIKERNRRAKELRKQGYTTECKTWHFGDLARGSCYTIHAVKPK